MADGVFGFHNPLFRARFLDGVTVIVRVRVMGVSPARMFVGIIDVARRINQDRFHRIEDVIPETGYGYRW